MSLKSCRLTWASSVYVGAAVSGQTDVKIGRDDGQQDCLAAKREL